jgi:tetratricopeptide (TPR) repeat protein
MFKGKRILTLQGQEGGWPDCTPQTSPGLSSDMSRETPEYWKKMADGYFKIKNYSGAITCYSKAIESDSDNPAAWHCMGACYENLGKYADAAKCFREERRLLNEKLVRKTNPDSIIKIRVTRRVSPVRIISTGLLLVFFSAFFFAVLSYEVLGSVDYIAALLIGFFSAGIYLVRIYLKQR